MLYCTAMSENELLARITFHPDIFGGKPIVRGRRLAVEHVLGMLAAGDTSETVSYTHLDVYKRQQGCRPVVRLRYSFKR